MRGIRFLLFFDSVIVGITPAHAGNTIKLSIKIGQFGDHPRACGEYRSESGREHHEQGSPPRMRGIRNGNKRRAYEIGITPAHAGNTPSGIPRPAAMGDHPRACGEYLRSAISRLLPSGSPPRMRGILCDGQRECVDARITPAHAGNTHTG